MGVGCGWLPWHCGILGQEGLSVLTAVELCHTSNMDKCSIDALIKDAVAWSKLMPKIFNFFKEFWNVSNKMLDKKLV